MLENLWHLFKSNNICLRIKLYLFIILIYTVIFKANHTFLRIRREWLYKILLQAPNLDLTKRRTNLFEVCWKFGKTSLFQTMSWEVSSQSNIKTLDIKYKETLMVFDWKNHLLPAFFIPNKKVCVFSFWPLEKMQQILKTLFFTKDI